MFRNENQSAEKHALKIKRGLKARYRQTRSQIMSSFSVDLDEVVLNQFSNFCALAEGNQEGHEVLPAVIPSLYGMARTASPCIPAILAMAWMISAPFATVTQRMGAARRKYGEAVAKLQDALQDPRTAKADDALFTVLLMIMLEVNMPISCLFCCFADFKNTEHDRHIPVNAKPDQAHLRCHYVGQFSRIAELCERRSTENVLLCESHLGMPKLVYPTSFIPLVCL